MRRHTIRQGKIQSSATMLGISEWRHVWLIEAFDTNAADPTRSSSTQMQGYVALLQARRSFYNTPIHIL